MITNLRARAFDMSQEEDSNQITKLASNKQYAIKNKAIPSGTQHSKLIAHIWHAPYEAINFFRFCFAITTSNGWQTFLVKHLDIDYKLTNKK